VPKIYRVNSVVARVPSALGQKIFLCPHQ